VIKVLQKIHRHVNNAPKRYTLANKFATVFSFFKDPNRRNSPDRSGRVSRPAAAAVVLCAVVSEPGSTEVMENLPLTSHARHPLLYTMIPSLDFRQGAQIYCIQIFLSILKPNS
jgi:hypothetical protein